MDAKPDLLVASPMMPFVMEALDRRYTVHRLWTAADRRALLAEAGPRIRALATSGSAGAGTELIAALPKLGVIVCHGVGLDAIDLDAAAARGIPVTTTPRVLTDDVADMALALLFAVCRRIPEGDAFVRSGAWAAKSPFPLGRRVTGKRAGIVGLGQIGAAIARRLAAFDVSIAYVDRLERPGPFRRFPDPASLAGNVDFLILAASGGADTDRIVNGRVLEALGRNGVLINVARGSLVDEDALLAALESGGIAGAGLDVFRDEPRVPERFLRLRNVVLLPHQASATVETRTAMGQLVLDNLEAFFSGRPLLTPLAPDPCPR